MGADREAQLYACICPCVCIGGRLPATVWPPPAHRTFTHPYLHPSCTDPCKPASCSFTLNLSTDPGPRSFHCTAVSSLVCRPWRDKRRGGRERGGSPENEDEPTAQPCLGDQSHRAPLPPGEQDSLPGASGRTYFSSFSEGPSLQLSKSLYPALPFGVKVDPST